MTDLFDPGDHLRVTGFTVTSIDPTTGDITADITFSAFPGLSYDVLCAEDIDFSGAAPVNPAPLVPVDFTHTATILLSPDQDFATIRRN